MNQYSRDQLVGQWVRNCQDEQGNPFVEHAEFFPDGSFEFCFMTMSLKGDILEQTIEMGDWGLVGDVHFTITKNEVVDENLYAADLNNADNYHAYQVTQLSADSFSYQHLISKESFILKRVIDNIGHC
ncbi:hypothetical protein [Thalassotalea euphylliae]|uniref:DUF1579 domain-containing protein n=1 Tax=Thalassotalea euphylliae TaxID=1655234 RepID=A0A3E0U573_9GAMM|nr:hypothetical protein [Thalassotalea euphylliae]REL32151.1 hypothetical protein DXX94_16285 [Thalassotalea euphylliae]REL36368.1 hypothetical protein DXX92_14185 [Thalassotalea euphylliae]